MTFAAIPSYHHVTMAVSSGIWPKSPHSPTTHTQLTAFTPKVKLSKLYSAKPIP